MNNNSYPKNLENNMNFIFPSWNQIYNSLIKISEMIKKSLFKPDIIVGVSRGGWIPARIISDLLQNQNLANLKTEFYYGIGKTESKPFITQPVSVSVKNKNVLVVDEVTDSGKSLTLINHHLKNKGANEIKFATIYLKPQSSFIPNYYQRKTSEWIVFPWELKEATRLIVEKLSCKGKDIEFAKEQLINSGMNKKLTQKFIKEIFGE